MSQEQAPESTDIRVRFGLDSLFQTAQEEVKKRSACFAASRKAGELAVAPAVFSAYGAVNGAEYVLAFDKAGQLLSDASDIRMYTGPEDKPLAYEFSLLDVGGSLSNENVTSIIDLANQTARKGLYVHRTVVNADAPLPEQLIPLGAHTELADVA